MIIMSFISGFWFCYFLKIKKKIVGNSQTVVIHVEADTLEASMKIEQLIEKMKELRKEQSIKS